MPERSKMRFFSTQCEEGEKLPNGFVAAFRGQLSTAGIAPESKLEKLGDPASGDDEKAL